MYEEAAAEVFDREIFDGLVKEAGVVSGTGMGDGFYNVGVVTDKTGEAIAVLLVFIYNKHDIEASEQHA